MEMNVDVHKALETIVNRGDSAALEGGAFIGPQSKNSFRDSFKGIQYALGC